MNAREQELMEAELQRLKPARPPELFRDRLLASLPAKEPLQRTIQSATPRHFGVLWTWLRWLAPVSAVGLFVFVTVQQLPHSAQAQPFQADAVEIDQTLVSSFEAVAELPDGKPVRLRCREWTDSTVFHDTARGVVVQRNTPRLEVVPVALETY
jgi:hypothetical protein